MKNVVNEELKKQPDFTHAFMILDLDAFKQINDTYGHGIGDEVLINVANTIKYIVNKNDFVGRIGGDEFIIFLPNIKSKQNAYAKAKQITDSICSLPISENIQQNIKASIGISLFPETSKNFEQLYLHADFALQSAKKQSQIRHAGYGEIDIREIDHDSKTTNENAKDSSIDLFHKEILFNVNSKREFVANTLLKAIENKEFEIYLHSKTNKKGECCGAECLSRWNSTKYGFLPPMRFIGLFEKANIIAHLDMANLEKAVMLLAKWATICEFKDFSLSINQCAYLVAELGYIKKLKMLLKKYDVDPSKLTVEITERSTLSSLRTIEKVIKELRKLNVNVAIDDFGSGNTSLLMLKTLNVNEIKLDKLFLADGAEKMPKSKSIIKNIVKLAHDLKINVVAEGVETVEQRNFLVEMGCDELQGFLIDKPMPIAKFESMHKKTKK